MMEKLLSRRKARQVKEAQLARRPTSKRNALKKKKSGKEEVDIPNTIGNNSKRIFPVA